MFKFLRKSENFMQIPLDVKGGLYVSPMPFGPYDTRNALMKTYVKNRIKFVVVLVTDDELERKAKRDLLSAYKKNGISIVRFPIVDYTSPDLSKVSKLVDEISGYLRAGSRVAVHCNAGVGRTAVVVNCVVQNIMKMSADDAIHHVKQSMQTRMTNEQVRLVKRFDPLEENLEQAEQ